MLVFHPHLDNLSPITCLTPQPRPFKPDHSSPTNCVNSSPIAHIPPPPYPLKPDCSSPTSTRPFLEPNHLSLVQTMSMQSLLLVSCLHHLLLSPTTCLLPPPCPLEPEHSFFIPAVSIQAQPLVSTSIIPCPLKPDHLSPIQLCQFEHNCSSSTSIRSFQAWPLVFHPTLRSMMESVTPLTQQCCHHCNDVGDTATMMRIVLRWHK